MLAFFAHFSTLRRNGHLKDFKDLFILTGVANPIEWDTDSTLI